MHNALGAVVCGSLACILASGQTQHTAQVCNGSGCYTIDTSVMGGIRYEDYKVTNPNAVEFDPAQRSKALAALGPATAQILCQAPPEFTTPAPTITFSNAQAQIHYNPPPTDQQQVDVSFSNFTASNGYASPSFGFSMSQGFNADGSVQPQFQVYVHPDNPGLEQVSGLTSVAGYTINPPGQSASLLYDNPAPSDALLREAVLGAFTHTQSISSSAIFSSWGTTPSNRSLWTSSGIITLAGQAQTLIAAAAGPTVPLGPPFSCTVLPDDYTSCIGQDQMDAFQDEILHWGGEYLGLRTPQSFNKLVDNLVAWAQANAPSVVATANLMDIGFSTGDSFRYSLMETTKPILMLWPTLQDDPALAASDRLTIENWIENKLMPLAPIELSFSNNHGYFGASVEMADAIRRSDNATFEQSIQKFYVALNQMRSDGSFPQEAERSACSASYTSVALGHLVSIAEMAATQGYDLYSMNVNGKTLTTGIDFLLNAFENPALINQYSKAGGGVCYEGNPGDPADFSFLTTNIAASAPSTISWFEPFIARFPFSTTAALLRSIVGSNLAAAPFPLTGTIDTSLNATCAFRTWFEFQPVSGAIVSKMSGNAPMVMPNQVTPAPLSVRVTDSSGKPLANTLVSFAVVQGSANVAAPTQLLSDANGMASASVTMGPVSGPVTVTAKALGVAASFSMAITGPAISAGGIAGIAGSIPAVTTISPGALFSIYGQNFVPAGTGRGVNPNEIVNGMLPTTLLGVCVSVEGISAPLLDVFPGQINAVAPNVAPPPGVEPPAVEVVVTTGCGTAGAVDSFPQSVIVAQAAPEFFYFQNNANGQNPVAAVDGTSGAYVGPAALGPSFAPAHPGDIVTIYASGFGPTKPGIAPGFIPTGAAQVTSPVTVTLGSVTLNASDVLYAGVAPGEIISQLNIRIPSGTPAGNQPLQIVIGGIASPPGAFLVIAPPGN